MSWNLDSRPTGQLDAKVELLRRVQPDLLLLQELSRPVYRTLIPHKLAHERIHERSRLFSWGATDLSDPRGSDRRLGCAVLGAPTTTLLAAQLLDDAPFGVEGPELLGFLRRTVAARMGIHGGRALTACSFHARRAVNRRVGHLAPAFHTGIAKWLASQPSPILFGMDANAPVVDHPDFRRSSFHWPTPAEGGSGEDQLLGPDAGHGLGDVLRRHLDRHPEELARIREERPGGPLAISHRPAHPVRYDHIWATPDLEVIDVRYLYDEAVVAGSDHALVLADFDV
ncbi:MAG: endonuclease/exonuclease/phosphatase family protein [Egibacteraceae bacterium]